MMSSGLLSGMPVLESMTTRSLNIQEYVSTEGLALEVVIPSLCKPCS
jgi:hypothetical protein